MFWKRGVKKASSEQDPLTWHVGFIVALAAVMRPAVYVELGVHKAQLFNQVIPYAGEMIGVDVDQRCGAYIQKAPTTRFWCGTTESFAAHLRDVPMEIDMLFIDADHSWRSVVRDFRDYFPFVREHGLDSAARYVSG